MMTFFAESEIPLEDSHKLYYFLCLTGGGIVGWGLEYIRKRYEIKQLKADIISSLGNVLKEVQTARKTYTEACSKCTIAATNLTDAIRNNCSTKVARELREKLCGSFLEEVIPAYHSYVEWKALQLSDSKDELKAFLSEELLFELRRFDNWLTIVNRPTLLNNLNQTPAKISKNRITPFYQLAAGLPKEDKEIIMELLRAAGNKLLGNTDSSLES